ADGRRVNLATSLLYAAERAPAAEAVVGREVRLTYAELREHAARIAAGLSRRGVGQGDRVACVLRNHVETVELYWACQWLGPCFRPPGPRGCPGDKREWGGG